MDMDIRASWVDAICVEREDRESPVIFPIGASAPPIGKYFHLADLELIDIYKFEVEAWGVP